MAIQPGDVLLTDKVVVVTGAAQGIGRAVALSCAAFGARLALCDRNADGLASTAQEATRIALAMTNRPAAQPDPTAGGPGGADRGAADATGDRPPPGTAGRARAPGRTAGGTGAVEGARVVTGVLDVRDGEAVAGHLEDVRERFGRVDVLVNNAGGTFVAPFLDVNAKGQQALVDENFTSVTHFVRGCVPLVPPEGGAIVNVTSIEAHRAGPGVAIYAAMKAAVENLTRSLALELADRRIRVNCIAVDAIPTEGDAALAATMLGDEPYETPWPDEGEPDDVAAAVLYLAGRLGRFVTGTTLHVGGGTDASRGWRRGPGGTWVP